MISDAATTPLEAALPYHAARVTHHLDELRGLFASADRRMLRRGFDRLVRTRFLSVRNRCLCTPEARALEHPTRFDGWVHRHHADLNLQVGALFDVAHRFALLHAAERYQTDVESGTRVGGTPITDLRFLQDWFFASVETEFNHRFARSLSQFQDARVKSNTRRR